MAGLWGWRAGSFSQSLGQGLQPAGAVCLPVLFTANPLGFFLHQSRETFLSAGLRDGSSQICRQPLTGVPSFPSQQLDELLGSNLGKQLGL